MEVDRRAAGYLGPGLNFSGQQQTCDSTRWPVACRTLHMKEYSQLPLPPSRPLNVTTQMAAIAACLAKSVIQSNVNCLSPKWRGCFSVRFVPPPPSVQTAITSAFIGKQRTTAVAILRPLGATPQRREPQSPFKNDRRSLVFSSPPPHTASLPQTQPTTPHHPPLLSLIPQLFYQSYFNLFSPSI
jgi:hypothetical protein